MIIKGNQRGGARQLALHLLNAKDNEHVEVHEVTGFVSHNLVDALHETYAISKGTQCKQFLFSVSINPPQHADVSVEAFQSAIGQIEKDIGLSGQPRAIIFHEKEARRHCHVVWSRINIEAMKAINLPFYHNKLMHISREQFIKHGWDMPRGMINKRAHDPTNCSLAEWQQAKRTGRTARDIRDMVQDAWALSDDRNSFSNALRERGFWLARGDRRSYVAIDHEGEIYSVPKLLNLKTKNVQNRLGPAQELSSVSETKAEITQQMNPQLRKYLREAKENHTKRIQVLTNWLEEMKARQKSERQTLDHQQKERWECEQKARQARFKRGFPGLWERVTGKHTSIRRTNELEAIEARSRDDAERHTMRRGQMTERRKLQVLFLTMRERHATLMQEIHKDISHYIEAQKEQETARQTEGQPRRRQRKRQRHQQAHDMEP